jgi:hypothetical protein
MKSKYIAIAVGFALFAAFPAGAHHSQVMYDGNTDIEMSGTVKEFSWTNPHTWLYLTVMDENGNPSEWAFESNSTGQLTRVGWSADAIKAGDEISVVMHPLRDGTRGGTIVEVHLADGTVLPSGGMRPDPIRGSEVLDP